MHPGFLGEQVQCVHAAHGSIKNILTVDMLRLKELEA